MKCFKDNDGNKIIYRINEPIFFHWKIKNLNLRINHNEKNNIKEILNYLESKKDNFPDGKFNQIYTLERTDDGFKCKLEKEINFH